MKFSMRDKEVGKAREGLPGGKIPTGTIREALDLGDAYRELKLRGLRDPATSPYFTLNFLSLMDEAEWRGTNGEMDELNTDR